MSIAVDRGGAFSHGESHRSPLKPTLGAIIVFAGIVALAMLVDRAIEDYRDRIALSGLGGKPSPVSLIVAGEPMIIPANMIRFRAARRGGIVDRVDLLL